jgi:hypothetical protein
VICGGRVFDARLTVHIRPTAKASPMTDKEVGAVLSETEKQLGIKHRDGVPWHAAPRPSRWHWCSARTWQVGVFGELKVERCPCGAIRLGGRGWMKRNSRRKDR